MALGNNNIK